MRLIHDAKDDLSVVSVVLRQLNPQACELLVCWAALADDRVIPASIVVHVQDTVGAGLQARLHEAIVLLEDCLVERAAQVEVDEILPADGKAKDI